MTRRSRLTALVTSLVTSLVTATLLAVPAPARAAAQPHISLTPRSGHISATGKASFSYRVTSARLGSHAVLQVKDHGAWTTLARSAPHHGTFAGTFTVSGPGEPGRFPFRAIILRAGHIDGYSGPHTVYAFATVSLKALCNGVLDNDCEGGTATYDDGTTFTYSMLTGINEPSDPFTAQIGAAKTSCRSLKLRYISDSPDKTTTYLELRQPGQKAQKHKSSSQHVSSFNPTLTGGKFGISVDQDASQVFMYFAGSGYCYTKDGKA